MKKFLFFVIVTAISLNGYAQNEFKSKFKPIPPKNSNLKKAIPSNEVLPKITPPVVVIEPKTEYVNPEDIFLNYNLYKKVNNTAGIFYKRNQYLGGFKTKSFTSTNRYRDAAFVDRDKLCATLRITNHQIKRTLNLNL